MSHSRILTMDGGNGENTALLLEQVHQDLASRHDQAGFLDSVDIFAGCSDGGINSLFFAKHEDPTRALRDINRFWREVFDQEILRGINPATLGLSVAGLTSIASVKPLQSFFIRYFGKDTTLGDLQRKVMILSFQLDNEKPSPYRRWVPKVFHNLHEDGADLDERVVDVALRSSAVPILLPLYQGLDQEGPVYVDGGVVANNPSMVMLAHLLHHEDPKSALSTRLGRWLMFSVGTGRNIIGDTVYLDPSTRDGVAPWGYGQWLANPTKPLLLMDAFLQAGMEAVSMQCQEILGESFHRLQPTLSKGLVTDNPDTELRVEAAVRWLESVGWVEESSGAGDEEGSGSKKQASDKQGSKKKSKSA
ncbi:MAG: patatin-like phospholipase family protein [Acidobacteriota bacterium]|jgi:patatin-like phospholipase/acyl hydrolase